MSLERRPAAAFDEEPFAPEIPEQRDDNSGQMLIAVAVVAMIVGVFVWWSVISSFFGGGDSGPADVLAATPDATSAADSEGDLVLNCDDFGPQRALSEEREAAYQAQCVSPTPEPGETPPPDTRLNRESCEEIRGTDYRSPEERTWFLANCVSQ